ncbi:MAG: histidinol-phosphatase [Pseudomonadota bacterium]
MSSSQSAAVARPDIVESLHVLADAAADQIMPHFRTRLDVSNKAEGGFDPVTVADKAAEEAIRKVLLERFPDHGIIGEEYGVHQQDAELVWVIDPIDGTRAFIQGMPTWGTLIALMENGVPVCGVMNQPFTGERYWSDGRSSYYRGPDGKVEQIGTRATSVRDAQMSTTTPDLFTTDAEIRAFTALKHETQQCRHGADCYAYALLAAGHVDVVLETGLQIYDIAALVPIIEHAGGRVTDWSGEPAKDGGQILACGDPSLHGQFVEILQQAMAAT